MKTSLTLDVVGQPGGAKMDSNAAPLITVFERKLRLEVPLFQRQYVWNREQQWEPLWEDISRKFVEYLENRTNAPVHFLGAMVLDQKQTPVTHVEKRQIIDGQQRLITLQIVLAALRDFCWVEAIKDLGDEVGALTLNSGMMPDRNVDQFKVWPTQLDRPQFSAVILSKSRAEVEDKYPQVRRKYARKPEPRPKIIEAYLYFYEQLTNFFKGDGTEPPLYADIPIAQRLETCFQALKNGLRVVAIDLGDDDDAQIIFETLLCYSWPAYRATLRVATAGEKISKPSRLDRQNKTISPRGWRGV